MSEKDEEVLDIKKDKKEESMQEIGDNNIILEDLQYKYEEKLEMIKSLGYEESFIKYDENDNEMIPKVIVICREKDKPVGTYTLEEGFKINDLNESKLLPLFYELEERKQLEASKENESDRDEENEELEDEENEKSENGEKNENEGELTTEVLQKQLGSKYKVVSVISYVGNEQVVDKIHSLGGIVGRVYKIKDEETGEIYPGGICCDGEIKVMDDLPKIRMGMKINKLQDDGTIKQESFKEDLTFFPGESRDSAMVLKENVAYKVIGLNGDNPVMIKMDEEPLSGKKTTHEQDEIKDKPKEMEEITNILDRMISKDYITEQKKLIIMEEVMNNGRDSNKDIEQLKKFEAEKDAEKQEETEKPENEKNENNADGELDENEWDPRDPYFQMEQRLRREREINN